MIDSIHQAAPAHSLVRREEPPRLSRNTSRIVRNGWGVDAWFRPMIGMSETGVRKNHARRKGSEVGLACHVWHVTTGSPDRPLPRSPRWVPPPPNGGAIEKRGYEKFPAPEKFFTDLVDKLVEIGAKPLRRKAVDGNDQFLANSRAGCNVRQKNSYLPTITS